MCVCMATRSVDNVSDIPFLFPCSLLTISKNYCCIFILGYGMATSNEAYGQISSKKRYVGAVLWTRKAISMIDCMSFCIGKLFVFRLQGHIGLWLVIYQRM